MINFEDITPENWEKWKEPVLRSELIFPESLRSTEEEFRVTLDTPSNIAKIIRLDGRYIGNAFGCGAVHFDFYRQSRQAVCAEEIHINNIVIEPPYQGHGHGTRLLQEFMGEARRKGYKKLIGFFRPNHSLRLVRKLDCVEKSVHPDWFGTGEDYVFCEIDLSVKYFKKLKAV